MKLIAGERPLVNRESDKPQVHFVSDRHHPQLNGDLPKLFDGSCGGFQSAVAYKADWLVIPSCIKVVEGVLKCAGVPVTILWRDNYKSIQS